MDYKVVVIGTGFGGSMTALTLADRTQGTNTKILMLERGTWWTTPVSTVQDKEVRTRMLLQEKNQPVQVWSSQNHFLGFLDIFTRCLRRVKATSLTSLLSARRNEDGLLDLTWFGERGWFGPKKNDGVMIARACGVGGGSLIYSNITIRPPNFVLDDPRWPLSWTPGERDYYYQWARDAISVGVVHALREREAAGHSPAAHPHRVSGEVVDYVRNASLTLKQIDPANPSAANVVTYAVTADLIGKSDENELRKGRRVWLTLDPSSPPGAPLILQITPQGPFRVNTGLSNILSRTARLDPHVEHFAGDAFNPRGVSRVAPATPAPAPPDNGVPQDPDHVLWLDRARVFQSAMRDLTSDFGAVDLAINDLASEPNPFQTNGKPKNYCERQGRCNIGCLPGARHTLNKQLMRAAVGTTNPKAPDPDFRDLEVRTLCEVDVIEALDGGGYRIQFDQQDVDNYREQEAGNAYRKIERRSVTAEIVIVAAGTVGSNEILLRSKARGTLPGLSPALGLGFSTNGDYIAFLEPTKDRVSLIRGPVTTSFGHFHTDASGTSPTGPGDAAAGDPTKFHTIEDQGIPPSLASVLGQGIPLIQSLSSGHYGPITLFLAISRFLLKQGVGFIVDLFRNHIRRGKVFESEEEIAANMMCVVAMGREASDATFRLGDVNNGETALRLSKPGNATFWSDPVYAEIEKSLERLAGKLRAPASTVGFTDPLLSDPLKTAKAKVIATSHPLGGCRMATTAQTGTVNELGQVFNVTLPGAGAIYPGLYVADGSIVPTALGVNPSLTISALALRVADGIHRTHFAPQAVSAQRDRPEDEPRTETAPA